LERNGHDLVFFVSENFDFENIDIYCCAAVGVLLK
jgi:hypothetical protein